MFIPNLSIMPEKHSHKKSLRQNINTDIWLRNWLEYREQLEKKLIGDLNDKKEEAK